MNGNQIKRLTPVVVAVAGLIGSIALFLWATALEREQAQVRFEQAASDRSLALKRGIDRGLNAIESLEAFYRATANVGREEFKTFVQQFFSQGFGLQALEWIPRITDAERRRYSQQASDDLAREFRIVEMDSLGRRTTAAKRNEYFPVYFVEPYEGNEAALGFDLSSNPARAAALSKARDTGGLTATERITLIQETGEQYGYLLFSPVYDRSMPIQTVAARRIALRGFVLGVFRVGDQVEALLSPLSAGGISIYVFDVSASAESSFLYFHESRLASNSDATTPATLAELQTGVHHSTTFNVGDRTWQVIAVPLTDNSGVHMWIRSTAAGGLLAFSLLLALYLSNLQRRSIRVEELVYQRTRLLTQAEARIRAMFDTAVEAIITIDQKGLIQSVNPAAERLFGYAAEELDGQNVSLLMPAPFREEHDVYLAEYLKSGVKKVIGTTRELTGRHKGGATFPMELAVNEWFAADERMFTGIVRDISDRKMAEDRVLETAKIKSHFVTVVSHELRTPLTAIAEGVNLVLEGKAGETFPEQRELLSISKRNIDRLSRLINEVLDFQKLETGGLPLRLHRANLNAVVREVRDSFDRVAKVAGIELVLALDEDLVELECDCDNIMQVLANLVNNAIKFSRASTIRLITEQLESTVRVTVEDDGVGIAPDDIPQLFKPFSQLPWDSHISGELDQTSKGTGLGLAISKLLIEQHGGSIDVHSSPGVGSSFFFTLPSTMVDGNS